MRPIILITSCAYHLHKNDECRKTWLADATGKIDYKFVFGAGRDPLPDELVVQTGDDYLSLPSKIRESHRWAYENDYDFVLKTDCDMYVCVPRLLDSGFWNYDYSGNRFWGTFCLGAMYWLSRRATGFLINTPLPPYPADGGDDVWVGRVMAENNIQGHHDTRYYIGPESDIPWDNVISLHTTDLSLSMTEIHARFKDDET